MFEGQEYKGRPFWQYRTVPEASMKDAIARIIVEPFCRLNQGFSKPSHFWNCYRRPMSEDLKGYEIEGDPNAFQINNVIDGLRMENRRGWQTTRAIGLNHELIDQNREIKWWMYAWSPQERNFLEEIRVGILPNEAIRPLIGPNPFFIFGIGSDGTEVPLHINPPTSRNDKRYIHLPLF